jgi:ADP-ribosylglycohydrolase
LRYWLLCLPAGIGLATLRSILKLWFGSSPSSSGVFSAGNGAAMRSAIIGVIHCEDSDLRNRFIKASTVITHTDPKALFGARVVADLAAFATRNRSKPNMDELRNILVNAGEGGEWAEAVRQTMLACESGNIEAAVSETGFSRGISGYILHTLPVAVSSWYIHHGNFRKTIETIVSLGGDTDTVAAIAGSLAGISSGRDGIPDNWISGIADYPHGVGFISGLSDDLSEGRTSSRGFSWMLLPRGIVFTVLVLGHGFRRLLPPY